MPRAIPLSHKFLHLQKTLEQPGQLGWTQRQICFFPSNSGQIFMVWQNHGGWRWDGQKRGNSYCLKKRKKNVTDPIKLKELSIKKLIKSDYFSRMTIQPKVKG